MSALIECVPNFSEGRDGKKIGRIVSAIRSVSSVMVLDVDSDPDYNRTVVTFAGAPEKTAEAAFRGIFEASMVIDMTSQTGCHPRVGATDVCPFVPLKDFTITDCVNLASDLGQRVWDELGIPVYLYGRAARNDGCKTLSGIRKGEYEGLAEKLRDQRWCPDFGPPEFNARSGVTIIGARPIMIAYNVNLASANLDNAREISRRIRESGCSLPDGGKKSGLLKAVQAMGVFLRKRGVAQVSMNLLDYETTPMHAAFDACAREAVSLGDRVNGSELIGMVPEKAMIETGVHALGKKAGRDEMILAAVKYLGLDAGGSFDPNKKILESALSL